MKKREWATCVSGGPLFMDNQKYVIIKAGKVIRQATHLEAPYAGVAIATLKPDAKKGEKLYLQVVVR